MDEKKQISHYQETNQFNKLIIDFGNTLTKIAVFQRDEIIRLQTTDRVSTQLLQELKDLFNLEHAIISSVTTIPDEVINYLQSQFLLIQLNHNTAVPVTNLYQTPETLGNDRLAVVVAAAALHPGKNCLVIDAGTCITYDIIDKDKNYFGGSISPGMALRFRALNTFTKRLPLVTHRNFEGLTGATTEGSIQSGVLNGIAVEIDGIISQYSTSYPGLQILITGGDMNFFAKNLKSNIFAVPNLVLIGLNKILEFNVGKR